LRFIVTYSDPFIAFDEGSNSGISMTEMICAQPTLGMWPTPTFGLGTRGMVDKF